MTPSRCGSAGCSRYIVVGSGHCVVHGPVQRCTHMSCIRNALPNETLCDVHTVQRQCVVAGCLKIANVRVTPCPAVASFRAARWGVATARALTTETPWAEGRGHCSA